MLTSIPLLVVSFILYNRGMAGLFGASPALTVPARRILHSGGNLSGRTSC